MKSSRLGWIAGLTGLAMIGVGGAMYYQERKSLGRVPLGRRLGEAGRAPMLDSYNDGNMRTVLRGRPGLTIEERITEIQKLVRKSVQDPEMRKLGLQITNHCPERDKMCEAKAIYDAIKGRIRYTGDIGPIAHADGTVDGIDLYQSARRTWEFRGGDCDDHNILGATLLAVNGMTPQLRVVKTWGAPDWEHIYTGFTDYGKFVPIDTTLPGNTSFGIEPRYSKKRDFPA